LTGVTAPPRLLVSSVVRGAERNQCHGGLYLVDFDDGSARLLVDWDSAEIDVAGRGGDRGLRGIGIDADQARIWVAATDRLLLFDASLKLIDQFASPFLRHCHELSINRDVIHIVSTGFDAVLTFDPAVGRFTRGLHLAADPGGLRLRTFDPGDGPGPEPGNRFHLNNVTARGEGLFFSGLRLPALLREHRGVLANAGKLPPGTHNAQPFGNGVIFNDTASDRISVRSPQRTMSLEIADAAMRATTGPAIDPVLARPFFARGLLPLSDRLVVGGASPSTVSLYDLDAAVAVARIGLSDDVRNAIHGIAAWPF
jgi:hypothetical protein